jgi:transposase InsO family protein
MLRHTFSLPSRLHCHPKQEVFTRFRRSNLTIKLSKCDFFPRSIEYLGHIVEEGAIRPNPKRVEKLRNIRVPRSVSELRSVLGHFSYYREYIHHFSEMAAPLTNLLKKQSVYDWRPEFSEVLKYFTNRLAEVTLANALESEDFLLETDASEVAVGAVLSCRTQQGNWRPVEFGSRTLSETERHWPAHEREAYAIVWALDKFDHFLRGRIFRVHTDNSSLEFLNKAKKGKLARWAARMAEYSLEIYHQSGAKMQHVDYLSRYVEPADNFIADRMLFIIVAFPTIDELRNQQQGLRPLGRGYMLRDGLWFYRGKMWVPEGKQEEIIAIAHMQPPFVHPGARRTKAAIMRFFCWPNIHEQVARYIKGCLACQRIRPGPECLQGLVRHHPASDILDKTYMDIWQLDIQSKTYFFLTLLDWNTRWVECCLLRDKSATEISRAFIVTWVSRFGVPKALVTDNEPSFVSQIFDSLCKRLGIRKVHTTVYHPQGNAPIETFHRHLKKGLSVFNLAGRTLQDIDEAVQLCCLSYRSQIHLALGDSPAFRLYGVDLPLPIVGEWRYGLDRQNRERIRFLMLQRLDLQLRAHMMDGVK